MNDKIADKILVCVSTSPSDAGVIEYAANKARERSARLYAVHIENARELLLLPEEKRNRAMDNLRLAEQLGGETATLAGRNIAEKIIGFALEKGITKIIAGKPGRAPLKSFFHISPVDGLVRFSGGIDIEIVSGEPGETARPYRFPIRPEFPWADYGTSILFLLAATGLCFLMYRHFDLSNLIMVYLLAVMLTAIECGRGPAILASLLSVLAFDFFFVPPRFSFTVDDAQYIVTFIVMFAVALAISHLTVMMRRQAQSARMQERQAAAMHGLSRQLVGAMSFEKILKIAVEYISEIFESHVLVMLPDNAGRLKTAAGDSSQVFQKDIAKQLEISRNAFETGEIAGCGTENAPENEILYAPLQVAGITLGVVALRPGDPQRFHRQDQRFLFESLVKQVALSLEVEYLTEAGVPLQTSHIVSRKAGSDADASPGN